MWSWPRAKVQRARSRAGGLSQLWEHRMSRAEEGQQVGPLGVQGPAGDPCLQASAPALPCGGESVPAGVGLRGPLPGRGAASPALPGPPRPPLILRRPENFFPFKTSFLKPVANSCVVQATPRRREIPNAPGNRVLRSRVPLRDIKGRSGRAGPDGLQAAAGVGRSPGGRRPVPGLGPPASQGHADLGAPSSGPGWPRHRSGLSVTE